MIRILVFTCLACRFAMPTLTAQEVQTPDRLQAELLAAREQAKASQQKAVQARQQAEELRLVAEQERERAEQARRQAELEAKRAVQESQRAAAILAEAEEQTQTLKKVVEERDRRLAELNAKLDRLQAELKARHDESATTKPQVKPKAKKKKGQRQLRKRLENIERRLERLESRVGGQAMSDRGVEADGELQRMVKRLQDQLRVKEAEIQDLHKLAEQRAVEARQAQRRSEELLYQSHIRQAQQAWQTSRPKNELLDMPKKKKEEKENEE